MDYKGILESETEKLSEKITVQLELELMNNVNHHWNWISPMPMMVYFFTKKQWKTISEMVVQFLKASISLSE
ncbi:hypothetical protein ASD24_04735 [Paenibacillus sp. Root52]|uniref:Uncharacterized protein n=1 Tax=Paenibacillus amylolyticus TaxID=1451 RepID=A0AAP5LQW0_PAEAM|nr:MULTISPECIES: hypothetical protein [Paenibacillus]KQY94851.1 hypothetical protein ASD24_04735 [Paenibacillus sp. Root52]MDR6723844.1 hypothetical protein [Paenibacillus amylolyticus]